MSNKGIVVFARNNEKVDYVKQAVFLSTRVKKYLDLPISIVTDDYNYLKQAFPNHNFDKVIPLEREVAQLKTYSDGSLSDYKLTFKNIGRSKIYDLTPYEETLVLDTDVVICNDIFKHCFHLSSDFQIYKDSTDISFWRDDYEFKYVSEATVDFYWATAFFFRKSVENKIFFDLVKHVDDNWHHYRALYHTQKLFRNDYVFSIAIHIMNGFQNGSFAGQMPGKIYHSIDKDILIDSEKNNLTFLIEKEKHLGEYTALKTFNINVHVMNKFSLSRLIDKEFKNE